MKYKLLLVALFGLSTTFAFGQHRTKEYKNYKFQWDSATRKNLVLDTQTMQTYPVNYQFNYKGGCWFVNDLVYVKTGDMKGLTNLWGKKILSPCHYIRFDYEDSIISAYICNSASWIFLNFDGDTLSQGKSRSNYCPNLKDSMNPARILSSEGAELWGFLDSNAKWLIEPKFQEVLPFKNGLAKVKINSLWGAINTKGEFIVKPKFGSEVFEE